MKLELFRDGPKALLDLIVSSGGGALQLRGASHTSAPASLKLGRIVELKFVSYIGWVRVACA